MKWVQPWFLRMSPCHTASRGPAMRMASATAASRTLPAGNSPTTARQQRRRIAASMSPAAVSPTVGWSKRFAPVARIAAAISA